MFGIVRLGVKNGGMLGNVRFGSNLGKGGNVGNVKFGCKKS